MGDGARLAVTLFLPASDEPAPCVLEACLPQGRPDRGVPAGVPAATRRARLAVARVDVRGTGSSDGLAPTSTPRRSSRTCASRSTGSPTAWCDRPGGMSARRTPASTRCTSRPSGRRRSRRSAPSTPPTTATPTTCTTWAGCCGSRPRRLPAYMVADERLPPVPALVGDGWRDEWQRRSRTRAMAGPWIEEQHDAVLAAGLGAPRLRPDRLPDVSSSPAGRTATATTRSARSSALREQGVPHRLLIGPWSHMSTATSLPGPHLDLVPVMARWWDRWLRGDRRRLRRRAGADLVRAARRPGRARPRARRGRVAPAPSWPLAGAREDAPRARRRRGGVRRARRRRHRGVEQLRRSLPWGQPTDQRYDDAASLTWEWPADGLSLLGHPRLRLRLRSSGRWRRCRPSCATSSPTARRRC